MQDNRMYDNIKEVMVNMPSDWLSLTTHRLDIYNEKLAKVEFLEQFEKLYEDQKLGTAYLKELPTAYDYIRLGHPLSCILEWSIAKLNNLNPENVISFSSCTIPILAILRKNLLDGKKTRIAFTKKLPETFDIEVLKEVYGYKFDLKQVGDMSNLGDFDGTTIFISQKGDFADAHLHTNIDFYINCNPHYGSVLLINGESNDYVSDIQHVRRRETIAMTPDNCLKVLNTLVDNTAQSQAVTDFETNQSVVLDTIKEVTGTAMKPLLGSSGLSIQYAIMMGLINDALVNHSGKQIKFIVPPNCYGGTNDQARRVAACLDKVDIVDLPVDGDNDMVKSIDRVLRQIALEDAIPYIIAEIPTNPRVEVPDLIELERALSVERKTATGDIAVDPVFILDQTFCPNVQFLGDGEILSKVRTISYASGSKFPSGGRCTAGYCVGNKKTEALMKKIEKHLILCNNEATELQIEILAKQLPTMIQRIKDAYANTREFVNFIQNTLPDAKINFVSEELANQGFTPSVFSLDLPTKGATAVEKESYKRALNHRLINLMISEIPNESKHCVSYGQLGGCYWTIPATSTQGTTKEDDKDYIARVSLSPDVDMALHKKVFLDFVSSL